MSVSYQGLWNILEQSNLRKKDLCEIAGISHASVAKLAKNDNVTTDILEKVCVSLNCSIGQIMEITGADTNKAQQRFIAYVDRVNAAAQDAKPILKWAGGKGQLLSKLEPIIPEYTGKYIEPFFGGGALFFDLEPQNAVIADSNPELINCYQQVANNLPAVIEELGKFSNTEEQFYATRALEWEMLSPEKAAARMIFLNKTCFNGLYRVNRKGQFNVPYGKYKNPTICDEKNLQLASKLLKKSRIICGDYLDVLDKEAKAGDFVFLDPPYVPISEYGDFKRYTKEQFYEEDHVALAEKVKELYAKGVYVILTNSNHPLVQELYKDFELEVVPTKRHISCDGEKRTGEDVIVKAFPEKKTKVVMPDFMTYELSEQVSKYPATRFMGSKSKLLAEIWKVAARFKAKSVLDLFSGSGVVGYMFKAQGLQVTSNDYMAMSATFAKAMIENNTTKLSIDAAKKLLIKKTESDHFVSNTFDGLYFSKEDNDLIDTIRTNIKKIRDPYKKAIAMTALIRACTKKRPRGIFTYVGERYNDGRKDLQKTLEQQFLEAVDAVNLAVFDNGCENKAIQGDALALEIGTPDIVYMDPPYYSKLSDNEYVRRYHFVEGLARDWKGVEIQEHTATKKFKSYPTPFSKKETTEEAFATLFEKYKDSILIISYSSNSLPTKEDMISMLEKTKKNVEVVPVDYTYSFGNQKDAKTNRNHVQEYLFVAY